MQTITFTHIECGECGGTFGPDHSAPNPDVYFVCERGHERHVSDFLPNMDEGESLTVRADVLGYTTTPVRMCPECDILAAAPGDRYCEPCRDGVNNTY